MSDTFTTVVLKLDEPTKNFRTYSSKAMQELVDTQKAAYYGTIGMPMPGTLGIDLDKVSHMVTNLRVEGDKLVGDVKVLKTPQGLILEKLLDSGVEFCYRPSGHGKMDTSGNVTEYTLVSVNAVNPDTAA